MKLQHLNNADAFHACLLKHLDRIKDLFEDTSIIQAIIRSLAQTSQCITELGECNKSPNLRGCSKCKNLAQMDRCLQEVFITVSEVKELSGIGVVPYEDIEQAMKPPVSRDLL